MKKIFIIAFVLIFTLAFPIYAFAEEADALQADELVEQDASTSENNAVVGSEDTTDDTEEVETFFGRIHAYFEAHTAEIGAMGAAIAAIVLTGVTRLTTKKGLTAVVDTLFNVKKATDDTADGQNNIVKGLNGIVDAMNLSEKEIKKITETVDWIMKNMEAVLNAAKIIEGLTEAWKQETEKMSIDTVLLRKECDALIDIIDTVYLNNRNVSQGVKDIVSLKYAEVLKARKDAEALTESEA